MKDLIKDLLDSTWWLVNAVSSGTDPKETNKMAADIGVKAKALSDAHTKVHVPQHPVVAHPVSADVPPPVPSYVSPGVTAGMHAAQKKKEK